MLLFVCCVAVRLVWLFVAAVWFGTRGLGACEGSSCWCGKPLEALTRGGTVLGGVRLRGVGSCALFKVSSGS